MSKFCVQISEKQAFVVNESLNDSLSMNIVVEEVSSDVKKKLKDPFTGRISLDWPRPEHSHGCRGSRDRTKERHRTQDRETQRRTSGLWSLKNVMALF